MNALLVTLVYLVKRTMSGAEEKNDVIMTDQGTDIKPPMESGMLLPFCWGNSAEGQLGLGGIEDEQIFIPRRQTFLENKAIKDVACGNSHTLFVMENGRVFSCGNNDHGQLGHNKPTRKKPEQIEELGSQEIVEASCGHAHSVVLSDSGQVYTFGDNSQGQLGHGAMDNTYCYKPKLVKHLSMHEVVQIASGAYHTLALTKGSQLYTWGQNSRGQLGNSSTESAKVPVMIACLSGLAIAQIAAGSWHSFILSVSGAVYGWGRNSFGQLGVGDDKDHHFPTLCKTLRTQKAKYIAGGEQHTAVLTQEGGVFTFGGGSYGQLGHNSKQQEFLPRKVFELMGSEVTQIACGRCHTLAYVPKSGRIYAFGLGGNGQLGEGRSVNCLSPTTVLGPFVAKQEPAGSLPANVKDQPPYIVLHLYSGGDQSIVTAAKPKLQKKPDDMRVYNQRHQIVKLTAEMEQKMTRVSPTDDIAIDFVEELELLFSSPACMAGSFLQHGDEHYGCSSKHHGLNLEEAQNTFTAIGMLPNNNLTNIVYGAIERNLIPSLEKIVESPADQEVLRIFLSLPYCKLFDNPQTYSTILRPFAKHLLALDKVPSRIIDLWWAQFPNEDFLRLVTIYKQVVVYILSQPGPVSEFEILVRQQGLTTCMGMLKKLNTVNLSTNSISYEKFYIPELRDKVDIKADYINWIQQSSRGGHTQGPVSLCNYPFVFDGVAKTVLLQTDALIQMTMAVDEANRRNMAGMFLPMIDPINPCLVLVVSRDNLLQDTLGQLAKHNSMDLKKPLKIRFTGEEGLDGGGLRKVAFLGEEAVDEGGVRKEFFMLLLREILDPKYGMFHYHEESRLLWFNSESFEDTCMFALIGVLVGLAIYNSTIIDLHFPLALYKKMLKKPIILDDLKSLEPSVGRSLGELLAYDGDDIEETFCLTFEINREMFGHVKRIDLMKDGSQIAVNKENRKDYVAAYLDYVFNKSVSGQFDAFNSGFHRVAGGKVLELFQPLELQAMVVGNENYDWEELENTTEYKGDYSKNHPTIRLFWQVFRDLSLENKKKFLLFLTGSDRIPIHGMKAIKVIIQSTRGGDNYLPVAHTCFNLLDLPRYTSKEHLQDKLLQAIQHTEGFGIV